MPSELILCGANLVEPAEPAAWAGSHRRGLQLDVSMVYDALGPGAQGRSFAEPNGRETTEQLVKSYGNNYGNNYGRFMYIFPAYGKNYGDIW